MMRCVGGIWMMQRVCRVWIWYRCRGLHLWAWEMLAGSIFVKGAVRNLCAPFPSQWRLESLPNDLDMLKVEEWRKKEEGQEVGYMLIVESRSNASSATSIDSFASVVWSLRRGLFSCQTGTTPSDKRPRPPRREDRKVVEAEARYNLPIPLATRSCV